MDLLHVAAHTLARGMSRMNTPTVRYIVLVIGVSFITITYWLAADTPSLWVLGIAAAGILVGVGITIAKTRAGHFNKD